MGQLWFALGFYPRYDLELWQVILPYKVLTHILKAVAGRLKEQTICRQVAAAVCKEVNAQALIPKLYKTALNSEYD